MRERLHHVWWRLLQWLQKGRDGRRVAAARARFWAEVREGQREAKARSRS